MRIHEKLAALGMSQNEISVYLSLLENGETTGYQLAKRTELSQPTVYSLLDKLRAQGLVLKIPHAKKQLFIAKDPRDFLHHKRKEIDEVEELLPELLARTHTGNSPKVLYFEGDDGFVASRRYMLEQSDSQEMISFFRYSPQGISKKSWNLNTIHFRTLGEQGVRIRGILPKNKQVEEFLRPYIEKYGWEIRRVSTNEYSPYVATSVIGNLVQINSCRRTQSTIIQDADMAKTERQKFEMLWKYAGEESKL